MAHHPRVTSHQRIGAHVWGRQIIGGRRSIYPCCYRRTVSVILRFLLRPPATSKAPPSTLFGGAYRRFLQTHGRLDRAEGNGVQDLNLGCPASSLTRSLAATPTDEISASECDPARRSTMRVLGSMPSAFRTRQASSNGWCVRRTSTRSSPSSSASNSNPRSENARSPLDSGEGDAVRTS